MLFFCFIPPPPQSAKHSWKHTNGQPNEHLSLAICMLGVSLSPSVWKPICISYPPETPVIGFGPSTNGSPQLRQSHPWLQWGGGGGGSNTIIRASLRFEKRLNCSINLRKPSIFYWSFSNRSEALPLPHYSLHQIFLHSTPLPCQAKRVDFGLLLFVY